MMTVNRFVRPRSVPRVVPCKQKFARDQRNRNGREEKQNRKLSQNGESCGQPQPHGAARSGAFEPGNESEEQSELHTGRGDVSVGQAAERKHYGQRTE